MGIQAQRLAPCSQAILTASHAQAWQVLLVWEMLCGLCLFPEPHSCAKPQVTKLSRPRPLLTDNPLTPLQHIPRAVSRGSSVHHTPNAASFGEPLMTDVFYTEQQRASQKCQTGALQARVSHVCHLHAAGAALIAAVQESAQLPRTPGWHSVPDQCWRYRVTPQHRIPRIRWQPLPLLLSSG